MTPKRTYDLAYAKMNRRRAKALRIVTAVASLPYPITCLLCRRGCHHERHFAACGHARANLDHPVSLAACAAE
jgi:hypothetical protein